MTAIIAKNRPPEGSSASTAYLARKFSSAPKVSMNTSAMTEAGTAARENNAETFRGFLSAFIGGFFRIANNINAMSTEPEAQAKSTV